MAWRPPKRLHVLGRWIEVRQVSQAVLQDLFADGEEHLWGGWHDETDTIYLLQTAPPAVKNRKYWHEVMHMLIDRLLDPA